MQKRSSNHVYDYVIVGSGIVGLSVAAALSKHTENIALLDSGDQCGGLNRAIHTAYGQINNGLRFFPHTDSSVKALHFLESLLETEVGQALVEAPPVTFESGTIKPFIGFGDQPPSFYDEMAYFLNPHAIELDLQPHQWVQLLYEKFKGDYFPRSVVTKFVGENGNIAAVTINGQKHFRGTNFVFAASPQLLTHLLPEDGMSPRARQKMAKTKLWTVVGIDFLHQKVMTDLESIHVLNGTTQDEVGPCVGKFFTPFLHNQEMVQFSQWLSFIDNDAAEEMENTANALKKIKRQIKRAYSDALEQPLLERIVVAPSYSNNIELKLNSNQSLPAYPNFWIAHGSLNPQKNLVGALLQAQLVISSLGFQPIASEALPKDITV